MTFLLTCYPVQTGFSKPCTIYTGASSGGVQLQVPCHIQRKRHTCNKVILGQLLMMTFFYRDENKLKETVQTKHCPQFLPNFSIIFDNFCLREGDDCPLLLQLCAYLSRASALSDLGLASCTSASCIARTYNSSPANRHLSERARAALSIFSIRSLFP